MQIALSTLATLLTVMASTGHTWTHLSQPVHFLSSIITAIILDLIRLLFLFKIRTIREKGTRISIPTFFSDFLDQSSFFAVNSKGKTMSLVQQGIQTDRNKNNATPETMKKPKPVPKAKIM